MTGVVKSYSRTKGYGFVANDGNDYFFRYTDIKGMTEPYLFEGMLVGFTPQQTEKGLRAKKVRSI